MADDSISGQYQALEELGRGSFGVVYKAIDRATGETVALKLIDLESSDDDIQEIQQEISVLSTCASPYVTQYKASYLRGHKLWIVMEYLGGGSCLDLLKPGNFSEAQVAVVCRELLRGLEYLHGEGKIHRDIKAANILLSDTGKVKLADFGVAAQLTSIKSMRNTFVGTPYWMAPEVIQQECYDFRADIWSLGITAMELAEGEPPLGKIHPMKVLMQIPKSPPPRLEGSSFSKDFKDFAAQCLVKDPERRPTAKELLKHRFIRSAGKVESLQELIERRQIFDANKQRKQHPVLYQETLHTISPKDESDEWVFDTVKSVAPKRPTMRARKSSTIYTADELLRKLDLKDAPLQPSSPAPGTVRKATARRQPSAAYNLSADSSRPAPVPAKRPLQPDMSFGNTGSTMRLFRRVPSDSSTTSQFGLSESPDATTNENRPPIASSISSEVSSKEAVLGRRLYTKAIDPSLAELLAQTSTPQKRDALAKLSDAFALLDSVDPEGAYHLMKNLVANMAPDARLNSTFLKPVTASKTPTDGTPQGTVIIKSNLPVSPTKLVLSQANPHLKSHRRRQASAIPEPSPEREKLEMARDLKRATLRAKLPGQDAPHGMEHSKQLSDVLYGRWIQGLRDRWPAV